MKRVYRVKEYIDDNNLLIRGACKESVNDLFNFQ